jgi:hypothetical protein
MSYYPKYLIYFRFQYFTIHKLRTRFGEDGELVVTLYRYEV